MYASLSARGIRAVTVEEGERRRSSCAKSPAASTRRIRPATDLPHGYTRQGARVVCRVVDCGTRGR